MPVGAVRYSSALSLVERFCLVAPVSHACAFGQVLRTTDNHVLDVAPLKPGGVADTSAQVRVLCTVTAGLPARLCWRTLSHVQCVVGRRGVALCLWRLPLLLKQPCVHPASWWSGRVLWRRRVRGPADLRPEPAAEPLGPCSRRGRCATPRQARERDSVQGAACVVWRCVAM